jgi:adenine/guanine phosphoribosyltransferase-like PRPP-binding protein
MSLVVHGGPRLTEILRRCDSHVEVADRARNRAMGVTNLKRIFGRPDELRILVDALAATVGDVGAIASADTGSAPLAAVVAYRLELPSVFIGEVPRDMPPGSSVHVIDDLVHSGETLASAARTLRQAGLVVSAASCLLIAPPTTGWPDTLEAAGVRHIGALATTTQL